MCHRTIKAKDANSLKKNIFPSFLLSIAVVGALHFMTPNQSQSIYILRFFMSGVSLMVYNNVESGTAGQGDTYAHGLRISSITVPMLDNQLTSDVGTTGLLSLWNIALRFLSVWTAWSFCWFYSVTSVAPIWPNTTWNWPTAILFVLLLFMDMQFFCVPIPTLRQSLLILRYSFPRNNREILT